MTALTVCAEASGETETAASATADARRKRRMI
jgi:hypothetical protein